MAIDFPNSPTVDDIFTVAEKSWIWDGSAWKVYFNPPVMYVQDTPPSVPKTGDQWYESDTGQHFVYYDSIWVETGSAITTNVNAGDLSGTTLASNVVSSSLTSVGTLTSLAVTGDVTVDTSTLKVDATNNRVGIGTASPGYSLDVRGEMRSLFYGEKWTITGTAANSNLTITTTTSCNVYTNLDSTANWGLQVVASGYFITDRMAIGDSFVVTHASNQGATGYYMNNGIFIDGLYLITFGNIKWQGGTAPTTGNTNTTDVYVFTIMKTGAFDFEVFGSLTKFGA
jgi:hypothetical protein